MILLLCQGDCGSREELARRDRVPSETRRLDGLIHIDASHARVGLMAAYEEATKVWPSAGPDRVMSVYVGITY